MNDAKLTPIDCQLLGTLLVNAGVPKDDWAIYPNLCLVRFNSKQMAPTHAAIAREIVERGMHAICTKRGAK